MADFDLSLAITADGQQAAKEINNVSGAVQKMSADEFNAAGGVDGLTQAFKKQQGEAKKAADALKEVQKANNRARIGANQLGMQVNDLATQITMGTSPMRAFSMQAGQIGFAMEGMKGKAGAFGAFLMGPWGAALTIGAMFMSMFVEKLLSAEKKAEDLTEAQKIQKMTVEELSKAIDENNKALGKSVLSGREAEQATLALAEAYRKKALETRNATVAELEYQRALLAAQVQRARGSGQGSELAALSLTRNQQRLTELEGELRTANALLQRGTVGVRRALVPIAQRRAEALTDPAKGITERHSDAQRKLRIEYEKGGKSLQWLTAENAKLNRVRDAEQKALQESNKKGRKGSTPDLGDQLSAEFGERLLKAAQGYKGVGEKGGKGTLQDLFRSSGISIDPEITAWCAAFVSSVLETQGAKGMGKNLSARSFLGWGQDTKDPRKGDVVVSRRGSNPAQGHVGFYQGTDAKGNIQVLGGNTGNRVGTQTVSRRDVLGFRRAPSASDSYRDEQQAGEKAARDAAQLADFGTRAATTIANMGAKAGGMSTFEKWKKDFEALNLLADELVEKKPPNWEALVDQLQMAGDILRDDIQAPFRDFIADQAEGLRMEQLVNQGREEEAELLRIVADLQERIGVDLLPAQVAAIQTVIAARKSEAFEAEKARAEQEKYLDAVRSTADAVRGIFDSTGQGLKDLPKKLGAMVEKLTGDWLFEKIFGDLFKDLENGITGKKDPAKVSSEALAAAIKVANASIDRLGAAADRAAEKLGGIPGGGPPVPGETPPEEGADVVVTGTRAKVFRDPASVFQEMISKLAKGILGKEMAAKLGKVIGEALQGAAIGNMAAGSILGERSKTGKIGASIGGALGGIGGKALGNMILPGIGGEIGKVLGSALGGVLGGMIGGKKKAIAGSSTITNAYDDGNYSGSGSVQKQASGLGRSVQDGLSSIAEQLGGTLGNFAVSIGTYKGRYRVDPTGAGRTKRNNGGPVNFDDDEGAAIAFAIADAIADGGITGLSAAVQKALKSSPDVERAMREALKVRDLERLLGGLGSELEQVFNDFERVASDRTRLATKYGLDLVKLEEITGKERAKVMEDTLKERIGSLRDFLNDMNFGDLFEGTPGEQRTALQGKIATTRTKAESGDASAITELANLQRQLVELTRENYGTAGPEYAGDRAGAVADAERIIAIETQRAQEAQERAIAQFNATTTQVQLQNEANNLLAQIAAGVNRLGGGGAGIVGVGGGSGGGYRVERNSNVALV